MGTVYRAVHALMDKAVAVKVLRSDVAGDAEAALRFHREARSASRLDHEHCIRVTDFGQSEEGLLFLVMELLEGESLAALLSRTGALDPHLAATLALAVAQGLAHAHEHGIIHRDLKPDNVFLAQRRGRYVVKVLDFGLAKIAGEGSGQSITRAGVIFGTPEYMAPEQAQSLPLDARTDLYSLGVMLYQMLVGELPFRAPSFLALLAKQVQEVAPLPSVKRPDIPPELEAIVLRCMAKSPGDRFASADEVAEALLPFADAATPSISIAMQPPIDVSHPSGEQPVGASGELAAARVATPPPVSISPSEPAIVDGDRTSGGHAALDTPSLMTGEFLPQRRIGRGIVLGVTGALVAAGGLAIALWLRAPDPVSIKGAVSQSPIVNGDPLVEARRLLESDDFEGADKLLTHERTLHDSLELQLLMGDLAERRSNVVGALAHFAHAARLAPKRAEPHARLASLLVLLGQKKDACNQARAALALDAKNPSARAAATSAGCAPRP